MRKVAWIPLLMGTHVVAAVAGFALGIYVLPILTAPDAPGVEALRSAAEQALYSGEFRRDLAGSDLLHWGEGTLYVGSNRIAFDGRLAPGPDYRLYLSPEFVETEDAFEARRAEMVQIGFIRSFDDFLLSVPDSIDPTDFNTAIVWCETFGEFITAAAYR